MEWSEKRNEGKNNFWIFWLEPNQDLLVSFPKLGWQEGHVLVGLSSAVFRGL